MENLLGPNDPPKTKARKVTRMLSFGIYTFNSGKSQERNKKNITKQDKTKQRYPERTCSYCLNSDVTRGLKIPVIFLRRLMVFG